MLFRILTIIDLIGTPMGDSRSQLLFPALILLGLRPGEIIPDKNTRLTKRHSGLVPWSCGAQELWPSFILPVHSLWPGTEAAVANLQIIPDHWGVCLPKQPATGTHGRWQGSLVDCLWALHSDTWTRAGPWFTCWVTGMLINLPELVFPSTYWEE